MWVSYYLLFYVWVFFKKVPGYETVMARKRNYQTVYEKKKRETERLIKSSLSHAIVVRRENDIFKNVYL